MTRGQAGDFGSRRAWNCCAGWLLRHQTALLVIMVAFFGRLVIAGTNSYWLDEIYSVYVHATTQSSTVDVLKSMWGIIHPPLYQVVLYHWIGIFGDSEAATRSLSNVFIMLASLFLYLFARDAFGKRVALAALIVFSAMGTPVTYALETRSYAMVIMWTAASSLAMCGFLRDPAALKGWWSFITNRYVLLLVAINTAVIFTHYYAAFFVAAQGAFILIYMVLRHDAWKKPWALIKLSLIGIVPPALLLLVWRGSMIERYRKGGRFSSGDDSPGFVEAFSGSALEPNLDPGGLVVTLLGLFVIVFLVRAAVRILGRRDTTFVAYMAWYVVAWLVGSFVMAFLVLKLVGQDAYGARYFAFTSPALALILAMGMFELVRTASLALRKVSSFDPGRAIYPLAGLLGVLLAVVTVVPEGYASAVRKKSDWRQIAELLARAISSDKDHSYAIYDTGWRQKIFDYYLAKQNGDLGVTRTVTVREEERETFPTTSERREIREYDYVVIVFTHLPYYRYRSTLKRLNNRYDEAYRVLMADGRGYVVFRVRS